MRWFGGRARGVLRQEARDLLRGGPPTLDLVRPVGPDALADAWVLQVLDLCLQVGEVLLSSGEPVDETSATMTRLAGACGLGTVDVDILFTSITICCHRGEAAPPLTSMRLVRYRATDLTRLKMVTRIVGEVEAGRMDIRRASQALAAAVAASHPYPRWVATAGWGGLAAAVTVLLGGPASVALSAFVVTACIDRLGRLLGRFGVAAFFLQLVGGMLAAVSALALLLLGALPQATQPSLVIAAGITVLLSGLSVVSTVQDAISGFPVTAAGRFAELALLSAGLLAGVILGLKIGLAFGVILDPAEPVATDVARFGLCVASAAVMAATFGLASYAPRRTLLTVALVGGAAWTVYGALTSILDLGPVVSTGAAAVLIGAASGLSRRGRGGHTQAIVLCGITPLLPGLTTYRGFYQLAVQDIVPGLASIILALAIGLALAAGVVLGDFLTRPRTVRHRGRSKVLPESATS